MANDKRGEVEFEALGKTFTLKLGNGAVRSLEVETSMSFPQIGRMLSDHGTATVTLLTQVFRAALKRHHPEITMEDCDDIVDEISQARVGELMAEAFQLMQPKTAAGGEGRPRKAATGSTGKS